MSNPDHTVKFCPKCKVETERSPLGNCKPCARARATAWYAANPERSKATRAANTERTKATGAAWIAANPERKKATKAAWYAANHKKVRALAETWSKGNPEATRIHAQNRRARKRANGGTLSKSLATKLFKLQRGKCACCGLPLGDKYHLDHIMPINLGGPNIDDNIQLLRSTCNQQKCAKHPVDFMQDKGFLL